MGKIGESDFKKTEEEKDISTKWCLVFSNVITRGDGLHCGVLLQLLP